VQLLLFSECTSSCLMSKDIFFPLKSGQRFNLLCTGALYFMLEFNFELNVEIELFSAHSCWTRSQQQLNNCTYAAFPLAAGERFKLCRSALISCWDLFLIWM
jgi:hypothetical protein